MYKMIYYIGHYQLIIIDNETYIHYECINTKTRDLYTHKINKAVLNKEQISIVLENKNMLKMDEIENFMNITYEIDDDVFIIMLVKIDTIHFNYKEIYSID